MVGSVTIGAPGSSIPGTISNPTFWTRLGLIGIAVAVAVGAPLFMGENATEAQIDAADRCPFHGECPSFYTYQDIKNMYPEMDQEARKQENVLLMKDFDASMAASQAQVRVTARDETSRPTQRYTMRVQIQQGPKHITGHAVHSDRPITARQIQMAFLQAIADMPAGYKKHRSGIDLAFFEMMLLVYRTPFSGGAAGEGKNIYRTFVPNGPKPNIRLDLENLRGYNLRQLW